MYGGDTYDVHSNKVTGMTQMQRRKEQGRKKVVAKGAEGEPRVVNVVTESIISRAAAGRAWTSRVAAPARTPCSGDATRLPTHAREEEPNKH